MAFGTRPTPDYERVGAGERYGTNVVTLSHPRWADGLVIGRFAHYDSDADEIQNMAGVDTPVVAGVVLRDVSNPLDALNGDDRAVYRLADRGRSAVETTCDGLVTVRVLPGDEPVKFSRVYAVNAAGDTAGMATTNDEAVATGAIFIQEVKPGVWLIRDRRDPQTVPEPTPVAYTLDPGTAAIAAAATEQFTVLADGEPVVGPLTWAIAPDDGNFSVDNTGLVTAAAVFDTPAVEYTLTVDEFPALSATITADEA